MEGVSENVKNSTGFKLRPETYSCRPKYARKNLVDQSFKNELP
jgi:hypothetical protein